MSESKLATKFYEWCFWFYDGTIMTEHYELDESGFIERPILEPYQYHSSISKVKRAAWIAISETKAMGLNLNKGYIVLGARNLPAHIIETHGEFPFIKRLRDIVINGDPRHNQYFYVIGLGGDKELTRDYKGLDFLHPKINGSFTCIDQSGNSRTDHTSEVIPALPPEAADNMPEIQREIQDECNC